MLAIVLFKMILWYCEFELIIKLLFFLFVSIFVCVLKIFPAKSSDCFFLNLQNYKKGGE